MNKKKRPVRENWFVVFLMFLSLLGWLRLASAINFGEWIDLFEAEPGPLYLTISGALLGCFSLMGALTFAFCPRKGRILAVCAIWLTALWYWIDWLCLQTSRINNGIFAAGMTLAGLGWSVWILSERPKMEEERERNS